MNVDFCLVAKFFLEETTILVVEHLKLWAVPESLEKIVGCAIGCRQLCCLAIYHRLGVYVAAKNRNKDVLVSAMAAVGEAPRHITGIQKFVTGGDFGDNRVRVLSCICDFFR